MKIDFVEVCGFRGFREKVRVDFGSGFTVISGRNGVGKSSLCDAIEFALTGSIDKYTVQKAAKETLSDYIWWRGNGRAPAHYVTLSFTSESGEPFAITRTRETGSNRSREEIETTLCSDTCPEDAVRQLCKTSIIRDEWIAALSVDLSETERFDLVRTALGSAEGADLSTKARAVVSAAETAHRKREDEYEEVRRQLSEHLAQVSEAQDALSRSGDVAAALNVVSAAAPNAAPELPVRIAAGREALVQRQERLNNARRAIEGAAALVAVRTELEAAEWRQLRESRRVALEEATASKTSAEQAVVDAQRVLEREESADEIAASLALLVEHGERLGLHDEHCPLCAAARTVGEFDAGIAAARKRIASLESGVTAARQALSDARKNAEISLSAYSDAESEWAKIEQKESLFSAARDAQLDLLGQLGFDVDLAEDPEGLERYIAKERDGQIELERALLTLEASNAVSRVSVLEDRVHQLRELLDSTFDSASQAQAAVVAARNIERAVKRVSAEIIDERLAQISPLLNELYQRLRPHAEWQTIDYSVRGDVRRFLSLRVGDDLNPQFVFSSGQRRAAGLAFLLSVHLARAWSDWRTLVLDDPVQHIDDYRALQLVEVLAAIRLEERQVICAVEDAALAELLCRRLVSTSEATGRHYDLDLDTSGAIAIANRVDIPPMPIGVLRRGSGVEEVG